MSKRCIISGLSALTEMIWKWTDEGSLCSRILMLELPSRRSRGQAFFWTSAHRPHHDAVALTLYALASSLEINANSAFVDREQEIRQRASRHCAQTGGMQQAALIRLVFHLYMISNHRWVLIPFHCFIIWCCICLSQTINSSGITGNTLNICKALFGLFIIGAFDYVFANAFFELKLLSLCDIR